MASRTDALYKNDADSFISESYLQFLIDEVQVFWADYRVEKQ